MSIEFTCLDCDCWEDDGDSVTGICYEKSSPDDGYFCHTMSTDYCSKDTLYKRDILKVTQHSLKYKGETNES